MCNDSVLQKVKKILAKTEENGATEAEAKSAFLLAQEILVKHGMSMSDIENEGNAELEEIERHAATHKYDAKFRMPLANVVGKNFRCEPIVVSSEKDKKRIYFIGYREDAQVCVEVFNSAYAFVYREAYKRYNQVYLEKGAGHGHGVVNAYALGFIHGLKNAFDVQCQALMVVTPPEVEEAKEYFTGGRTTKANFSLLATDATVNAKRDGYHDGKTFLNGARVGTPQ